MDKKIDFWSRIITICIAVIFILLGNRLFSNEITTDVDVSITKAKVVEITETVTVDLGDYGTQETIFFKAELKEGEDEGQIVEATQTIVDAVGYQQKEIRPDDNVLISDEQAFAEEGATDWFFVSHNKASNMAVLIGVFLLFIVIMGGWKGFHTTITLIITIGVIFLVYIPAVLAGANIYLITTIITIFIIFTSLIILNGMNKKAMCAILGNMGGLIAAGVLAMFANHSFNITGIVNDDYLYLSLLDNGVEIDFVALVWGGIIVGALGAIMDVAMSISSSMYELAVEMKDRTYGKMLRSGLNIGKDIIGTMTNTLILAYVGSSLAMLLLFSAYNRDFLLVLNYEFIIVEVIQSIVGSMGILLAVPATALFAAWVYNRE